MNQMQYEKKNTAFDSFEPTTVLLGSTRRCTITQLRIYQNKSNLLTEMSPAYLVQDMIKKSEKIEAFE